MSKDMDLKDKKLLYLLNENARVSDTQLARKINLSKNAIKYRIERLKLRGIIKQFSAKINLRSLNLTTFVVLLKFNDDLYKESKIIKYFKNHEFANNVYILSGDWDIFAEFICTDFNSFFDIIDGIRKEFDEILNTYQTFFSIDVLRSEQLMPNFYKETTPQNFSSPVKRVRKEITDEIDRKILSLMSKDSSLNFLEIVKKLDLTMDIVRYRMKNLIKNKVIQRCFSEIALTKLGYAEYLYILKLKNLSSQKLNKIRKRISDNDNISYAFEDKNSPSIIFACAFEDTSSIDSLSRTFRSEFSELIESQTYLPIKDKILSNLFPEGLIRTC